MSKTKERRKERRSYQKILEERLIKKAYKKAQHGIGRVYSQRDNPHQVYIGKDKGWLHFGLMGDMHLCSKFSNENGIKEYFARMRDKGVRHIFSCGDNMDGMFVYRDQINDLKVIGTDNQVDYTAEFLDRHLPTDIKLYMISGNHEGRAWEKFGVDMVKQLGMKMEDAKDLHNKHSANNYATVFIRPMITLDLLHGLRYCGERSAPEYLLMKTIDGYKPFNQPDLLGVGHSHKIARSNYRDCNAYLVGGFEYPNNFIARTRAGEDHGGWYIRLHTDDDKSINEIMESFVKVKQ